MTRLYLAKAINHVTLRLVKKCEICSAPATVFLTQIINGKSTKFCLCAKCAKERGLLDPDAFDLAEKLFPDLRSHLETEKNKSSDTPTLKLRSSLPLTSCPVCSFTLSDFQRIGRLGCSECYNVFEEEIIPLLNQLLPDSEFEIIVPHEQHEDPQPTKKQLIKELEEKLEAAIAKQEYERAAGIHEQLQQLLSQSHDTHAF